MSGWLWWVGGALLLGIAEIVSVQLVFLMLVGGALAGAVSSALGAGMGAQIGVAVVTSMLLLFALRPWLLRRLRLRVPLVETNAAALVAREAVVLSTTTEDGGRVKLGGEVWSARAAHEGEAFVPGTEVHVVRIEGATAIVSAAGDSGRPIPS
ncbi:MAG: NfeD family protein [Cellulomonas sp.]|uniref:NfeD family protein n=1 Tax=Cellulomonas sp. TaxID=40001 RepID=UPI0017F0953F|nr:NfeD family protein [Cellulomonas sp.]NMM15621.1 NfeD family protein [Cellulomonas sp.]NMM32040.1 NfeD family protein [Cellulomonas sp.]